MTREEALKVANEMCQWLKTDREKEALAVLVPELSESKDDRIIRTLQEYVKNRNWPLNGATQAEVLAYLEKQKELPTNEEMLRTLRAEYEKGVADTIAKYEQKEQKPEQYDIDVLEKHITKDSVSELAHTVIVRNGWEIVEKEPKPILEVFGFKVGDKVRLKDGDGRKHIIKSFEKIEGVHGPDFYHVEFEDNSARDGIYPGEEYPNGYYTQMEKFEEDQKPTEKLSKEEYVKKFKALCDVYEIKLPNREYDIYGLCEDLHKLFGDIQKPAEWSKEDERNKDRAVFYARHYQRTEAETKGSEECISWLKDLPFSLKKKNEDVAKLCSNEWSEEDKRKFNRIYEILGYAADDRAFFTSKRIIGDKEAIELQDFLKSLCLQPKQEWSEEDEKPFADALSALKYAFDDLTDKKSFDSAKDVKEAFDWMQARFKALHK